MILSIKLKREKINKALYLINGAKYFPNQETKFFDLKFHTQYKT